METYNRVMSRIWSYRGENKTEEKPIEIVVPFWRRLLSRLEPQIFSVQKLLLWETPSLSITFIAVVNIVALYLFKWLVNPYALFFAIVLVFLLHDLWSQVIWPEIAVYPQGRPGEDMEEWTPMDEDVMSAPELSDFVAYLIQSLHDITGALLVMRKKTPSRFYSLTSFVLLCEAYIGCFISGRTLFLFVINCCLFLPGILKNDHCQSMFKKIDFFLKDMSNHFLFLTSGGYEVSELEPKTSVQDMELLESISDPPGDSLTKDDFSSIDEDFPSHNMDSSENEGLDFDEVY